MIAVACIRTDGVMVRPRAWAVLRLITKSNVVGCSTGRSAGLVLVSLEIVRRARQMKLDSLQV